MISPLVGGVLLALVPVLHRALLGRPLGVSGRIASLVDRASASRTAEAPEMTETELAAAFEAATLQAFGAAAVTAHPMAPDPTASAVPSVVLPEARPRTRGHVAFVVGLALGGLATSSACGTLVVSPTLRGAVFGAELGQGVLAWMALALGGVLVGFGARMAGGCTSSHALCGLSRREHGSIAATAAFFGTGIVVAWILERGAA